MRSGFLDIRISKSQEKQISEWRVKVVGSQSNACKVLVWTGQEVLG